MHGHVNVKKMPMYLPSETWLISARQLRATSNDDMLIRFTYLSTSYPILWHLQDLFLEVPASRKL